MNKATVGIPKAFDACVNPVSRPMTKCIDLSFSITFKDSSNAAISRIFSYQANGFGAEGA